MFFVLPRQTTIAPQAVTGLPPTPDRIVISPAGRAAAFTYGTSVKILTGLPESLDRIEEIDVSSLPGAPAAVAISDDGAVLVVSVASDTQTSSAGGVFVFNRGDSGPRLVANAASDLSFFPDSHDALLTDETSNSVTSLQDIGGVATSQWVFVDDRLPAPSSTRTGLDGGRILVASAKNNLVALLDRNGGNPVFLPCTCSPDRVSPLSNAVYQLTGPDSGLLWILDLSHDPQLLFVPIPPASGESQ